jgi:hypothetical protein
MDFPVRRPVFVALAVVAVVVTAGCLTGPRVGDAGTEPGDAPTTSLPTTDERDNSVHTAATSRTDETWNDGATVDVTYLDDGPTLAEDLPSSVSCGETGWVGYWGTGDTSSLWEPGYLRVGWTVPANQSTLFVAFENDTAVGASHEFYRESSVTADGAGVPVEDPTGEGRYAVVMLLDVNGNGEYDPEIDRPCASDGDAGIAMTNWIWVDWNTSR